MKRFSFLLLLCAAGCFRPADQKVRPPEPPRKAAPIRPITADMVTPESGHRVSDQLYQEIEREIGKN